jgi:nucleotide-binding universal stress UspA family protein
MTILAATDLSDNSRPAIRYAQKLADAFDEKLAVIHVAEMWERDMSRILEDFDHEEEFEPSDRALEDLDTFVTETLGDTALERVKPHVVIGHPPQEKVLEYADQIDATVIVAGTSGTSKLSETFFGSTISALVRASLRPVLAVPPESEFEGFDNILAPVDLSETSEESLRFAGELSRRFGSNLLVLHSAPFGTPAVSPPIAYVPESSAQIREAAKSRVQAMIEETGLGSEAQVIIQLGPPHIGIMDSVKQFDADLIVMGTHGRKGVARFFLGSTAERILRERTCPVLVLRERPKT